MTRLVQRFLVALLLAGLQCAWAQQELPLAGSVIRFATLDEARAELSRDDEWIATTGDFQRSATLGTHETVSREQFRTALARSALAWTPAQEQRWRSAIALLTLKFEALGIRLPSRVLLVSTDGKDAANAPYTRGAAVFLPQTLDLQSYSDAELLAHEFFHVLTRHNPRLATQIYAVFGFEPAEPLEWPSQWQATRISNPDAPHNRHLMRVNMAGKVLAVMPVLVARRTNLQKGETFFSVLDVRLLNVEPGQAGRATRAIVRDGEPVWEPVQTAATYLQRLGGNTSYIFHAEETAADNFAFLVSGRKVPNPELLRRLEQVLLQQSTQPQANKP